MRSRRSTPPQSPVSTRTPIRPLSSSTSARPPPIRAACLREALGVSGAPPAPARPEGPRGRGLPLVPLVAGALCRAELKSTGVEAFKAKYKTRGACLRANAAKAAGIVKDARTQCASADRKVPCVLQAVAKALGLPARGPRS